MVGLPASVLPPSCPASEEPASAPESGSPASTPASDPPSPPPASDPASPPDGGGVPQDASPPSASTTHQRFVTCRTRSGGPCSVTVLHARYATNRRPVPPQAAVQG